jgi:Zn-dependent protease with chaperone function
VENRYESMLPRLAAFAKRHPHLYRARVLALAALGYGVILGLLLALVAVTLGVVVAGIRSGELAVLKIVVPLLVFIGVLVESLWIEIAPPKGMVLARTEAPALWAEIERVRRAMGAPAPYQVLIDGELNASVQQVPRLGIIGFYRTYLTIGLPLAASLTADEFRSVLAHEFGHVSGKHGRLGVWIYRVRATWTEVLAGLEESRHWTRGAFRAFLRWYAPYLEAYTAVLRRAHEFDADRAAAGVAGTEAAAAGLCRIGVAARWLDATFWSSVFAAVPERANAPADVFHRLLGEGPNAAGHPDAASWLEEEAGRSTEPWDSHPSLADRLASLGVAPALPREPVQPSAAAVFFGEHLGRVADRLGRRWVDATQYSWSKRHREHLQMAERLAALEAHADEQPLPAAHARERILLTVQLRGETVAMPLMRDFLDRGQDDPSVHFLLGRTLLEQDDETGLRHLERAMELDVDATPAACELAAEFLDRHGRGADAGVFRGRIDAFESTMLHAQGERDVENLSGDDRFLPHGLDEAGARTVAAQLATVTGLKRALLVRKAVTARPEVPCFVLAIERISTDFDLDQVGQRVLRSVNLPGTVMVVPLVGYRTGLKGAMERIPGAEVYRHGASARAMAR